MTRISQSQAAPHWVHNAVVVGGVELGFEAHGVYTAEGRFVENSALYQGPRCRSGEASAEILTAQMPELRGDYLFGGHVAGHFGHILLESFARLHLLLDRPEPLVFAELNFRQSSLFRQITAMLGLPHDRLIILDRPTRIERLEVFAPDLSIRNYVLPRYAQTMERLGDSFCQSQGITQNSDAQPLYISRSRTNPKGRYYYGEATLERLLTAGGYKIAYPETLPLEAQFKLLLQHCQIAGFYGSALHPLVFAEAAKRLTYLACEPINLTFPLLESVKPNDWSVIEVEARASGKTNEPKLLSEAGIAQVCQKLGVAASWSREIRQLYAAEVAGFEASLAKPQA